MSKYSRYLLLLAICCIPLKQVEYILGRFILCQRYFFKVVRERCSDEFRILCRQPQQERRHIVAVKPEDTGRADAVSIDVFIQERGKRELFIVVALDRKSVV